MANIAKQGQNRPQPEIINEKLPGQDVVIKYQKGAFLGKGGFAKCFMVKNMETAAISAAKVIDKETLVKERMKMKLMSEIKIHRSLDHENVVKFTHFFEDKANVYILLELCENQTLNELLKRRRRLQEIEVRCYLK